MNTQNNLSKYLWVLPALFVAYSFGEKLFEVFADKTEFADIISTIPFLATQAGNLAYFVGFFDLFVALALLSILFLQVSKKYSNYIFFWTMFWPLFPASLRYFGGVAEFEIVNVSCVVGSAIVAYILYKKYNR